jgi:REP element-mobilizing transposase RayT
MRREFAGAIYHVMNRGDRREDVFRDALDRRRFLATLTEACEKAQWQIHAWCLMRNHFHLVLETPDANLVAGMKWLLGGHQAFQPPAPGVRTSVCRTLQGPSCGGQRGRLREEMDRLGWEAAALRQARKGDARKVRLAARIRTETALSLKWIAEHLAMGSWTHVSNQLGAKRKGKFKK